jgi:di/tricarboxylate transporter
MGPGGYRFADYRRVGLPMAIVLVVVVLLVLPRVFPLAG